VAAPIFQRIAEAALRYLAIPRNVNPAPPVLVARHNADGSAPAGTATAQTERPVVSLVADGPDGTVPDVRGMAAREAIRKLVTVGLNARISGDGVVVSQTPAPGEPLQRGGICRLVLDRMPPRRSSEAIHP
jgi:cell division protein FtsI (penicillin-binding protein 3)